MNETKTKYNVGDRMLSVDVVWGHAVFEVVSVLPMKTDEQCYTVYTVDFDTDGEADELTYFTVFPESYLATLEIIE